MDNNNKRKNRAIELNKKIIEQMNKINNINEDINSNYMSLFGLHLKQLRQEQGLTQCDVATALYVGESTYANWEQGRREPNIYNLFMLANIFDVDMNTLLNYDDLKNIKK